MNAVVDYTEWVSGYGRADFTRIELERSPATPKQEVLMQRIKLGNERIREEGRQEGQREGVGRIALRMLADRIDDKDIIRLTKLHRQPTSRTEKATMTANKRDIDPLSSS